MSDDRVKDLAPVEADDPQVGWLLAALQATTAKWRAELGRVGTERVCRPIGPGGPSIGAVLLHVADAEVYWLHEVAAGKRPDRELSRLLMRAETDQYAGRWPQPPTHPLEWFNDILDTVRAESVTLMRRLPASAVRGKGERTYTLRRILHHVEAHEAYHGGQVVLLKMARRHGWTTPPPIVHSVYIAASPADVYRALATADGWNAWFTVGSEGDAEPGGTLRLRWRAWGPGRVDVDATCRVVEAIRDRRVVFRWRPGDSWTTVALEIEPRGPGAVLTVTETGYVNWRGYAECATGWGEALMLLKAHIEHGITYGSAPAADGSA
jgi:uncharacterized damage-inducible protein DinB/uncharacterized protein YndB with AHSA1/START domain